VDRSAASLVTDDLRKTNSSAAFLTHSWMWLANEESRWYPLVKLLAGNKNISIPAGLTFASRWGKHTLGRRRERTQIRRWLETFQDKLPSSVLDRLNYGFWHPNALRIHISRRLNIRYCIVVNRGAEPAAVAKRVIFVSKGDAFHDRAILTEPFQGRGFVSRMMANTIPLYRELDIKIIKLIAGLTDGSKVWPKFGFRPASEAQWRKVKKKIRHNLKRLDSSFKQYFEDETGERIESHVESILRPQNPQAIWRTSDLDEMWPSVPNWERGLGSFLLQSMRWRGILDLEDSKTEERLGKRLERANRAGVLR
jgi:hypothetical protein